MRHLKCVVVRDSAVGKTCIIMTYMMNTFPSEYFPMFSDNFSKIMMVDEQPISLHL
jgi:GTPase SAR1 family protein